MDENPSHNWPRHPNDSDKFGRYKIFQHSDGGKCGADTPIVGQNGKGRYIGAKSKSLIY